MDHFYLAHVILFVAFFVAWLVLGGYIIDRKVGR